MNYKSKLFSLPAILFLSISIHAQTAHNLSPNSICKYVKGKKNFEGMTACNACSEEGKKNQAAIEAEYKRKVAANETAQAEALKKLQQEQVKRNEARKAAIEKQSKNVVTFALPETGINAKKQNDATTKVVEAKAYKAKKKENVFYNSISDYNFIHDNPNYSKNKLTNYKGEDVILPGNNLYKIVIGASLQDLFLNFPENIAIVGFHDNSFDLIDNKGNRILNDNKVTVIRHFYDNFFFIGYNSEKAKGTQYEKAAIYNLKTKKLQLLDDYTENFYKTKVVTIQSLYYYHSSNEGYGASYYKVFAEEQGVEKFIHANCIINRHLEAVFYYIENENLKKIYVTFNHDLKKYVRIN